MHMLDRRMDDAEIESMQTPRSVHAHIRLVAYIYMLFESQVGSVVTSDVQQKPGRWCLLLDSKMSLLVARVTSTVSRLI